MLSIKPAYIPLSSGDPVFALIGHDMHNPDGLSAPQKRIPLHPLASEPDAPPPAQARRSTRRKQRRNDTGLALWVVSHGSAVTMPTTAMPGGGS